MHKWLIGILWIFSFAWSRGVERPNILWIVVEDMNPVLGCYGDEVNKGFTPHLDQLAAEGTRFSRAYVSAPVCSSMRSGLITGGYQTTLGIHNHRSSRNGDVIRLPEGVKTLPERMKAAGYFTFNVGKDDYNFEYQRSDLYSEAKGARPWQGRKDGQPFFGQIQTRGGKLHGLLVSGKRKVPAVDPASVEVPPYFPDVPLIRKLFSTHEEAGRATDAEVGTILENLQADGLLSSTVVVFFTDHGMNTSVRHKQFCYEGGVHVPLIMKGPGVPVAKVCDDLVLSLDITATTAALAGLEPASWEEGQDLFGTTYTPRDHVISARDRCDYTIDRIRTVRTDRFRYIRNFMTDRPLMQPQYRDPHDYLILLRKMAREGKLDPIQAALFSKIRVAEELYDLDADPHQIRNLARDPDFQKELQRHRDLLEAWVRKTDDKGQYPESAEGLAAVFRQWKGKCVNPEFDIVKKSAKP